MGKYVKIEDGNDPVTVTVNADQAKLSIGAKDIAGDIRLVDFEERQTFWLDGFSAHLHVGDSGNSGNIYVKDEQGNVSFLLDGLAAELSIGSPNNPGLIKVKDDKGHIVLDFDGKNAALYLGALDHEGDLILKDNKGKQVIHLSAGAGEEGKENARFYIKDWNGNPVFDFRSKNGALYLGNAKNEGDLILNNGKGQPVIHLSAGAGEAGKENTRFIVRDRVGDNVLDFNSDSTSLYIGNKEKKKKGNVIVRDNTGKDTIHLNGETGDILLGNADCAEEFDISELETDHIESGTVMKFDDNGKLKMSDTAYDNRIAGVVSGAGQYKPGIILDRKKFKGRRIPITLLGKVYCKVDAVYSKVDVGDLLTTSATRGYAMKVSDYSKAFGTIIGKAMGTIHSGMGLIPVLVSSG
jgi:hypothetical protein